MTTHSPIRPVQPPAPPWQPVWEIIRFELQESIRTRFVPIAFVVFFAVGLLGVHIFGMEAMPFTVIRQALGESTRPGDFVLYANSPLRIMNIIGSMIPFLVLVAVGIFAERATKDFVHSVDGLLFTSPLKEWQFATGRLIASFWLSLLISLGLGLGLLVGQALPWMDGDRIAPFNLLSYVQPYLYLVIPNLLIFGLFSFSLGLLTRRTLPSYLGLVAVLFAFGIVQSVFDLFNLDPFFDALRNTTGTVAIAYTVRFWTKVQQNTLNVPFAPVIWLSRLLFLGVSAAFFGWVWQRFSFAGPPTANSHPRLERMLEWTEQRLMFWKSQRQPEPDGSRSPIEAGSVEMPVAQLHYGTRAQIHHVWRIAKMELQRLLGNPLTLAILAFSLFVGVFSLLSTLPDGTGLPTSPTTGLIVQLLSFVMGLLAPLLIIFLAGDLVWRERDVRIDPLSDPLPVRSWVWVLGKLLALMLIFGLMLVVLVGASLLTQTLNQYTRYDLGVYAIGLFTITLVDLLLVGVLTITIQVLVNQKFLGYFLSAAMVMGFAQGTFFKNARLLQYGYKPAAYYSEISGYDRMLEPVRWFQFYWLAIALLLLCCATLFWVRGVDTSPKARWRIARQRFTRPIRWVMGLSAIAALCLGGWIVYNTQILTPHLARAEATAQKIAYEKAYGRLIDAQPKITAVQLQGDLYPGEDPRVALRGTYTLKNETQKAIDTVLLNVQKGTQVNQITVNGNPAKAMVQASSLQGYEFALASPLQPGATLEASFDLLKQTAAGFTGEDPELAWLKNSIHVDNSKLTPFVGFFSERITDNQQRAQAGLPPIDQAAERAKARVTQIGFRRPDAHRVQFSATLSTAPDQIAITSGNLMREWTDGNRRYFQYQSQQPIQYDVTVHSGRYDVRRDQWQGIPIEVYYHPGHDRNLQRILSGAKAGLDYASQNFGPYPHKSLRFVEVPYVTEAVSYPSVITLGERFGFLSKVNENDPSQVDNVFRIAAHEVGHQWWGQQLMPGAKLPGAKLLTESLAEYTSHQVFAQKYGPEKLGQALRQNLNTYLQKRSQSDVPLVEAISNHLVYEKGSLAMHAMQDYLGADVVNGVLAKLLKTYSTVPPYPVGEDLVNALRQVTPPQYQYLITDLFETVTLYDNKAEAATVKTRPDGKFDVTLTLQSGKVRSDNNGNETPVAMNDEIDVGVYNTAGKLIYLKKHPFKDGATKLTVTINQPPQTAGIDPLHKLIDKVPDDNVTNISETAS